LIPPARALVVMRTRTLPFHITDSLGGIKNRGLFEAFVRHWTKNTDLRTPAPVDSTEILQGVSNSSSWPLLVLEDFCFFKLFDIYYLRCMSGMYVLICPWQVPRLRQWWQWHTEHNPPRTLIMEFTMTHVRFGRSQLQLLDYTYWTSDVQNVSRRCSGSWSRWCS
jgi:hypothetical protein